MTQLDRVAAAAAPTSARLAQNLHDYDVKGEKSIALAQGAISCFILLLHSLARIKTGLPVFHSWVVLSLSLLIVSSAVRWVLAKSKELPERALDVLNVVDIAIFLSLIWSYQYAYHHPAGGSLKAPSFVLLLVLIALRALRFHPRPILLAGIAAVAGWSMLRVQRRHLRRRGGGNERLSRVSELVSYPGRRGG